MGKVWLIGGAWLLAAALAEGVDDPKPEVVLTGLANPCGIAVQPETGVVFIAESGAGRILRLVGGKAEAVVTGFPLDTYGKGPAYKIGPLGIAFQDKTTLLVGDGGFSDGQEFVRVFVVPDAGKPALDYEKDAKTKLGPLSESGMLKAEGNLFGVAATKTAVYVTCNGDDAKGWIARAEITGSSYGKLERYIPTKELTTVNAPAAITVNDRTGDLVVGQMGAIDQPHDSLLTFYNAKTGKLLLNLPTELNDITGLAYSPKTGLLYATDFSWREPASGGLYRLDSAFVEGKQTAKAVKIAALDRPTALAFDKEGTLYVAGIGAQEKTGQIWKFAAGL